MDRQDNKTKPFNIKATLFLNAVEEPFQETLPLVESKTKILKKICDIIQQCPFYMTSKEVDKVDSIIGICSTL